MEQAIAVEWGRFLRDLEEKRTEGLKSDDGTALETNQVRNQGTKQAAWERLQEAIARPPETELPLDPDPQAALPTQASGYQQQEMLQTNRSFLDQFARNAEAEKHAVWSAEPVANALPAPGPEMAEGQSGTYEMRSVWVGTGFEERRMLITPPAEQPTAEPQQAVMLESVSAESAPSRTDGDIEAASASQRTATAQEMSIEAPPSEAPAENAVAAPESQPTAMREDTSVQTDSWTSDRDQEREMWKSTAQADAAVSIETPYNGGKTSLGAHDQDGSRWFVLNGVLGGSPAQQQTPVEPPAGNVPVLEVFSLAGGVGKTSLVATLGRALSALGERVLLVEATPFGSLPYYFGACDCRPGVLRTFRPPASSSDAPIRLATVDPEGLAETSVQGSLAAEIQGWARGVSRVIVDVATRSTATIRGLARMSPAVLVPLVPDVNSVVTANSIDSFFHRQAGAQTNVYYVLNQFDPSLPLHMDLLKVLRERLGERLLPFTLQRTPAISEALAEGMTIMDYDPESAMAEDFTGLAKWLENVLAPADLHSRGMRWSER